MKLLNKTTTCLLTALSLSSLCNAQSKWAVGYQAGLGTLNVNSTKIALTNQGFISRKLSRKIEIEAAAGYTSWGISNKLFYENKSYTCNLTITAKYYLVQKSSWGIYLPLAISSTYIHTHYKFPGDFVFGWMTYNEDEANIAYCISSGIGANINVSNRFYLNAQLNAGFNTRKTFGSFYTRNAIDGNALVYGIQTGIGYRF